MHVRTTGLSAALHAATLGLTGFALQPFGHRGLYQAASYLSKLFPAGQSAEAALPHGARLRILLSDSYWARLLAPRYQYEPEVGWVIRQALKWSPRTQFLDVGANVGYWSAIASAIAPGRVTAVEASPPMHDRLTETAQLNDDKFAVWPPVAVWSCSGEDVEIVTHVERHAGASIVDRKDKAGQAGYQSYSVPSITIDDLAASLPEGPLLVKLDVEGAEIAALSGALKTIAERDTVFLYEDHGQDRSSKVSRQVFTSGYNVAAVTKHGATRLRNIADVAQVKVKTNTGYNFIAYQADSPLATCLGL